MSDFRSDDDMNLDAVFDAARRTAPRPSTDLLARIEADAVAVQAGFAQPASPERSTRGLRSLFPAFGGWAGMAGLAASVVIGIGVGVWQPVDLGLGTDQTGIDMLDETLFWSFEDALAEG